MAREKNPGFEKEREEMHLQMLSSVSHDLKTPLASIIGSLEIHERMYKNLSPEKKTQLILTALQEAYRLDNFITNILDIAKIENGMVKVKQEPCDIENLIRDCRIKMSLQLDPKRFRVHSHAAKKQVMTDVSLVSRAVTCLIENAVKHAGTEAMIDVSYAVELNKLSIEVKDNGVGIPEDQRGTIFDKYTRIFRKDHQNAGTGLGLSICRGIARLLKGDVKFMPNPSHGSIFTFAIPLNA